MSIILNGQNGETPAQWTTATRPASPNTGQYGYNTTTNALEYYNGSAWTSSGGQTTAAVQTSSFTAASGYIYPVNTTSAAITVTFPASPSAGNQITILDYAGTASSNNITIAPNGNKINGATSNFVISVPRQAYTFVYVDSTQGWLLSSQQYSLNPPSYAVSALIVAGGGGGGANAGAGAGGLIYLVNQTLTSGTTYSIVVGAGGNGGASPTSGGNSSAFNNTAIGGGGGNLTAGGSGSGAPASSGSVSAGGLGTAGQGNNGGSNGNNSPPFPGGGGGGAGAVGGSGSGNNSGAGGNGIAYSITGSSVYYAGGGGGGVYQSPGVAASGGLGGGGTGTSSASGQGTAGTANTGGGGGGGGNAASGGYGGAGGSGVVILSIPSVSYSGVTTGSPTITTSGTNKVLTFTSSGSYTA